MPKAIRFSQNGGPEVLQYVDVEVGAPGVNEAFGVVHKDVFGLDAQAVVELDTRDSRGACSRNNNFDLVYF
jgi:hypothetical protein